MTFTILCVCSARCGSYTQDRLASVRKLAASHQCPVICAEHRVNAHTHHCKRTLQNDPTCDAGSNPSLSPAHTQTADGIHAAAARLLSILKMSAGMSPIPTTALYLSTLTRCSATSDLEED